MNKQLLSDRELGTVAVPVQWYLFKPVEDEREAGAELPAWRERAAAGRRMRLETAAAAAHTTAVARCLLAVMSEQ